MKSKPKTHSTRQAVECDDKRMRHYISVPHLAEMLKTMRLRLSYSTNWEDVNDVTMLGVYKEHARKKGMGIICMTGSMETSHHWSRYGGRDLKNKACVIFDAAKLRRALNRGLRQAELAKLKGEIEFKHVKYMKMQEFYKQASLIPIAQMPFIKRYQFQDERERRIIWTSEVARRTVIRVPISFESIESILLSPWAGQRKINKNILMIQELMKSASNQRKIKVDKSRLLKSEDWLRACRKAVGIRSIRK